MAERRIETDIEINAPVARVWAILTDCARMPSWNPFITSISGDLTQGARLSVNIAPPPASPRCGSSRPSLAATRTRITLVGAPVGFGTLRWRTLFSAGAGRRGSSTPGAGREVLGPPRRPSGRHARRDGNGLQSHERGA